MNTRNRENRTNAAYKTNKLNKHHMHKNKSTLILPLLLTAATLFTACGSTSAAGTDVPALQETASMPASAQETAAAPAPAAGTAVPGYAMNTITVNSSEQVNVTPDIAEIVYAVRTEAKDAASCQQKNTADVNNVIELLKSLGAEESAIQTSDYYMYPVYNYSGNTQRITGYEASTTLTVSRLPIDSLDHILTESVAAGINNIQSITYQSSSYDDAYAQALALAMESAKIKAQALAEAGSGTLGPVTGIRENSNYSEARYTDHALSAKLRSTEMALALEDAAGTGIMPGEVNVEVNITVEYLLQPATP